MKITLEIQGNTYPQKQVLKANGWKFGNSRWTIEVDMPEHFSGETQETREFVKQIRGNRPECLVGTVVAGRSVVLFRSKTFDQYVKSSAEQRLKSKDSLAEVIRRDPDFL